MPISREHCQLITFGDPHLTPDQEDKLMEYVPGWSVLQDPAGNRLTKSFPFEDWTSAIDFVVRIAEQATYENHHPVLTVSWGRVTAQWWSHKIFGLHRNDFIMACRTDHLFESELPLFG